MGVRYDAHEDNACREGGGNGGGRGDAESQISTEPLSFSFTRTDEILGYSVNYNVPWNHEGRDAEMGVGDGEVVGRGNGNGGGMQEGYGMKEVGRVGGGSASGSGGGSGRTSEEQERDGNERRNGDDRGAEGGWGMGWSVRLGRWRS